MEDASTYFVAVMNTLTTLIPVETMPSLDEMAAHLMVETPRVRSETKFIKWYKMIALYWVWGWVALACPIVSYWALFLNDGGVFYNECYYMFYNGVVWYNPPEPYKFS